jgi:LacI family transcriptional regulator
LPFDNVCAMAQDSERKEGVTMADIAELAGVSIPTVSKVLNGRSDVSRATRDKVERMIQEQGYVRSAAARTLRGGRSGLVDVLVHDLESQYHLEVIRGVEDALGRADMSLVLSALHGRTRPARHWLEGVKSRGSDAVILVLAASPADQLAELRRLEIPLVVLDSWGRTEVDVPSVGATNWVGGFSATEHLLSLGHERVAMIGGPEPLLSSKARAAGYRAALEAAGVSFDSALLRPGDFLPDRGAAETHALFELDSPPTAIFAGSDLQALGVYRALRERGLSVPEDVSVVGFDDLPIASLATPPLTTVRQPLAEMGRMAVEMVVHLLEGEDVQDGRVEMPTSLVVRESSTQRRPAS